MTRLEVAMVRRLYADYGRVNDARRRRASHARRALWAIVTLLAGCVAAVLL